MNGIEWKCALFGGKPCGLSKISSNFADQGLDLLRPALIKFFRFEHAHL